MAACDSSDCGCFAWGHAAHPDNNSHSCNDRAGDRLAAAIVAAVALAAVAGGLACARAWPAAAAACAAVTAIRHPLRLAYAVSAQLCRRIRTPAVLDPRVHFPAAAEFERAFPAIRREVLALVARRRAPLTRDTFGGANSYIGSDVRPTAGGGAVGWRFLGLKFGAKLVAFARDEVPVLAGLLAKHDRIRSCGVSILPPGVCIPEHVGYYKGFLRYMLAIEIPRPADRVYLCVNGTKVTWREGGSLLFDDTFSHKVYNKTAGRRIVLYMDVQRALGPEHALLQRASDWIVGQIEASPQVRAELRRTEQTQALE